MDTFRASKRMVIIVFFFIAATQAFYTYRNIVIFQEQYEKLTDAQASELGKVIENYFSVPIDLEIPIERIGGIKKYLFEVIETAPFISFIKILKESEEIYSAKVSDQFQRVIVSPIHGKNGDVIAEIHLGVLSDTKASSRKLLIDLSTIIIACLVYTYELLIFIASYVIVVPGYHMIRELNKSVANLSLSSNIDKNSGGFASVLLEMEKKVTPMMLILTHFLYSLQQLADAVSEKTHSGKIQILSKIEIYKNKIESLIKNGKILKKRLFRGMSDPLWQPLFLQQTFSQVFSLSLQRSYL
ncbi:hypothetical protein MTBBW1_280004 [Desulfamplus magnetovallimortis]|uniref:Uncharacterized protein n=1 Tax=Desulfamplus magnetovallimortis TaxID=1246637 RepID=A0A1W1HFI9_9BACT|nr:hypothetical protein [Desulfamplus magnetovallimortis]SLM31168.1 hypothetical protein MTBBW1_280004 [Desulfamplus magnetovallimortis]